MLAAQVQVRLHRCAHPTILSLKLLRIEGGEGVPIVSTCLLRFATVAKTVTSTIIEVVDFYTNFKHYFEVELLS